MIKRKKRIYLISLFFITIATSIYLILWALRDNIVFFYSPTEIQQKISIKEINEMSKLRLGGMVKESSIKQLNDGSINFIITDFNKEMIVFYKGIIPDLFKEEQGVIAEGSVNKEGMFIANSILAKHDENYMPPEVQNALKKDYGDK
ncbi:MAG: cytochrome c maturation protein CcmE [Pseudomonadota bacterium]|jgi:cytochrome c-type biogenesis protein CcmE|nr:cytochrome c maturation protein CcmE [Pseudomonadota bacterium]MED5273121.1 cytochrome c maturation protein CcmE [Pseudomonadota bacterium]MED5484541.1 cytochrome c maturation protein CcmE [Pseudomonadota bacterium]|tara:strand:- start:377 stop:817 length:441 start_codon:yes stop_codon:yes gene_type:complete